MTAPARTSSDDSGGVIHVLHVDDDPAFADLTQASLTRHAPGIVVHTETDPEAALASFSRMDCVVSDYDMPEMNGLDLLRAVRKRAPSIPFVLFTGKGSEEIASEAISAGVTDYLQKGGPEQYEVLANRIENAVARRRAERGFERSNSLFDLVQRLSSVGGWELDVETGELWWTEELARIHGVDSDFEPTIEAVTELYHPDDRGLMDRVYRRAVDDAEPYDVVVRIVRPDGSTGRVRLLCEPSVVDGRVPMLRGAVQKVDPRTPLGTRDERLSVEEATPASGFTSASASASSPTRSVATAGETPVELDTSADALADLKRRALDDVDAGVIISEATEGTPTVFANEGFGRITGYDSDEMVGRNCRILQGAETDDRPVASMREAVENGTATSVVLRNYRKDGTPFWNEVEITPISDADGTVTHYIGFQRDVTERKRLQQELEAAQQSLRRLYTVTTDTSLSFEERVKRTLAVGRERLGVEMGFLTRIAEGTQTVVHAVGEHPLLTDGAACPLSESYCRRTLEGDGLLAVVHAATDEGWADDPGYERFGLECYLGGKVTVDGDLYGTLCFADTEARAEPFTGAQAAFVELLTRWISSELERRKRERELRVADRRFQSLFDNPMTFVAVLDPDGTVREVNDTARATLDGDPDTDADELLDRPFWETPWWTPDDDAVATVKEAVETAADGRAARFECDYFHADGQGTVGATLYPVSAVEGRETDGDTDEVVSLMAVGADTTRRTEQAAQLKRQRDRLEEFASVVSHDLRSPLEVARGRLELYDTTGDADHLDAVGDSLDRISTLIDDLLALARQGESVSGLEPACVSAVARQAWQTVETADATLDVAVDEELTVESDRSRLQQLFENLFRNSVEHGATGAQEGDDDGGDRHVRIRLTGLANGARGFAVEDDGPGIDPADRDYVFERGFSTDDGGTGFGLAIVRRITDAHGWEVRVTESPAGGARVEVVVES